ncbi:fimbrial protein [Providencia rettgeri]
MKSLLTPVNLFVIFYVFVFSASVHAFTCRTSDGTGINAAGGKATVFVDLDPTIQVGQNLVVDLANHITCKNDLPNSRRDEITLRDGSIFAGNLASFTGALTYYGQSFPFPLRSSSQSVNFPSGSYTPLQIRLFITPVNAGASGVLVQKNQEFARLIMQQRGSNINGGGNVEVHTFIWNIMAKNDVVMPIGGCDVSARDVNITLPDFPGSVTDVPLTVRCAQTKNVSYFLTGPTTGHDPSIFVNTASSPAAGVGVQISHNGGTPINSGSAINIGNIGTSPVSLGLKANYARTGDRITAGNVKSIVGVTFIYQ